MIVGEDQIKTESGGKREVREGREVSRPGEGSTEPPDRGLTSLTSQGNDGMEATTI